THHCFVRPRRTPSATLFPYTTLFRSALTVWPGRTPAKCCGFGLLRLKLEAPARSRSMSTSRIAPPGLLVKKATTMKGFGDHWSRSEEHTSELQSRENLVCRLLLEKKK